MSSSTLPSVSVGSELAAVSFGADARLPHLAGAAAESWPALGRVQSVEERGFTIAKDGARLFAFIDAPEDEPVERVARRVYDDAIELARSHGYPHILRMWNYLGDINAVEEGRERYQRFCEGRYDAFAAAGYALSSDLPAASAVGMRGRGLMTYFLAAKSPGVQVENPRQVSAYCYPKEYGPRSPSFSRATVWNGTLFVSGTSSVVGHETKHHGDPARQLEETLTNLEVVVSRAIGGTLSDFVAVKTYVRNATDVGPIAARLAEVLPKGCRHVVLQADICRANLLLEIEGVATRR